MITTFIKRRIWIIKSRPFVIMGLVFGLPAIVFLFFHTQSIFKINQNIFLTSPEWLIYFWFLIGSLILYININSDIQEYRFNNQKIFQLILSPVSLRKIIFYLVSANVIETITLTLFSGLILYAISGIEFSPYLLIYIIPSLFLFLFVFGQILTTISLLTNDRFLYQIISLCIFLACITTPGFGLWNINGLGIKDFWQYIPTSMIINFVFFIILGEVKKWMLIIIPIIILVILVIFNGEMLNRKILR